MWGGVSPGNFAAQVFCIVSFTVLLSLSTLQFAADLLYTRNLNKLHEGMNCNVTCVLVLFYVAKPRSSHVLQ